MYLLFTNIVNLVVIVLIHFNILSMLFPTQMNIDPKTVTRRTLLSVFMDSLNDCPGDENYMSENEVRYKIFIDSSEDGSVIHMLFSLGILDRQQTRVYVCSDFPGDNQTQKVLYL